MKMFYKTGKAAKLLDITNRTLNRLTKSGILIPSKITDKGYNCTVPNRFLNIKTATTFQKYKPLVNLSMIKLHKSSALSLNFF